MAELSIIGWVVSPVIESMIRTASSHIASHRPWGSDTEEDLHGVETTLTQILAVVGAAERRIFVDDAMQRSLLSQMKETAYEAEDLLDELDYLILKSKAEGRNRVSCRGAAPSSFFSARKDLALGTAFRAKLKKLLSKLDRVNSCAERFLRLAELDHENGQEQFNAVPWRTTCSLLLEDEVLGRDADCERVIELLMRSDDQADLVLPVVGDGGVGKTTLAQLIYNDTRVVRHFDLRMWVCVSDNFSDVKLTREILTLASDGVNCDINIFNYNKLQEELRRRLMSKMFLLILDDVWFDEKMEEWENKDRWNKLLAPLKCGMSGSKILVTTRMKLVARMLGATNLISLQGLGDEECWLLFKKHAFGMEDCNICTEIDNIGRQIARRLKGSPLCAKVVGGMLNSELDPHKWRSVLETDIYDGIMPVLRLSYRNLPPHLQRCFAYCSIFPRDWKFAPDRLVCLWMAQGFIQPRYGDPATMEGLGRMYFDDLLSRSFFQMVRQDGQTYFLMHDLMNDLARAVSRDECFRIEGEFLGRIPPTVRHLSVDTDTDVLPQLDSVCELRGLRTLVFFGSDHFVPEYMFKKLTSIRVLDLTGCDMEELPEAVGCLVHLRYLSICDNLITLPASLRRLYHLQVIDASRWCWFGYFPENIDKLISLRHINVPKACISKIAGIGKLTCLQELPEFHVSRKNGRRIAELKFLNELQGSLHIRNLEKVRNREEAAMAHLNLKKHIKALQLEWNRNTKATNVEILESLQPHSNLEELDIMNCHDLRAPWWLESNTMLNLKALYLTGCRGWKALPPLGQLPFLRVLKICGMHTVTRIGCEFYGAEEPKGFPSLEILRFEDMPEWVEWLGAEDYQVFPSLSELKIRHCLKLKGLPAFLPSLKSLSVRDAGPISNLDLYPLAESSPTCFGLDIYSSSALCEEFLHRHQFQAVEVLNMSGTYGLLPVEELLECTSLKRLTIQNFSKPTLSTVPQEQECLSFMPSSLVQLRIAFCGLDDATLSRCLWNLTSLCFLDMISCNRVVSLPSTRVLCRLAALQKLLIANCTELLSLGGLKEATSLKDLKITGCSKLLASLDSGGNDGHCSGLLPSSLIHLQIRSIRLINASLSMVLQNLISLTTLKIMDCNQITSLPSADVLCHLTALREISIKKCYLLSSLGGLAALSFLERLTLYDCPKLSEPTNQGDDEDDESSLMPSSLESIEINSCGVTDASLSRSLRRLSSLSSLKIECCNNITSVAPADVLCHLTSLKNLEVENCEEFASVEGLPSLMSLTDLNIEGCPKLNSSAILADLKRLSSLKSLNIMDGCDLQSLPDDGFPDSLEYLSLTSCHPTLKKQLTEKQGPIWEKISHISHVFY